MVKSDIFESRIIPVYLRVSIWLIRVLQCTYSKAITDSFSVWSKGQFGGKFISQKNLISSAKEQTAVNVVTSHKTLEGILNNIGPNTNSFGTVDSTSKGWDSAVD